MTKQMHLAAHFPGVNSTTVWADPRSRSQIDFASFEQLARTAERGKFDFFFLAEGLRLREHNGLIHDLDVVGRPESLTVLNALAAVTDRLGLAATVNATFNEPYELARRLATLDHLSEGRAAWNVVTSSDAFTGENFRRGGYLDRSDRYTRAAEFVATARELWDSWTPDGTSRPFAHSGQHFQVSGEFTVPRSPQGHPVVIQAGDSGEGREFAASAADVIFTRHGTLEAGRIFYADVKARLAKYGRQPDDLKIMPGVTVVIGDTDAEAQQNAAEIRRLQVSPQNAILALEQVWGRDLSSYDPDGPLPDIDPDPGSRLSQGRAGLADPLVRAAEWRALSAAKGLSIRQTVIETTTRQSFIGSPQTVAAELETFVSTGAADGFILVPHLTPGGLDPFVDRVVPLLQERGAFRSEYAGSTLRSHLGLAEPVWKG
ncbi:MULTISPECIES: NtaA/DmoA family FMN-dependent monooxygenase [Streptomyces]|uniref:FMN-dependent oxidoreductase (Nitrilotriacetate monooxygenase family) n=1 Tax=Streptomyces clavifer TaxID=68188 RepID=A0ABS4VE66_9ACTN|nr:MULTISPECIES: NtaA/DmoA family FMN-dependent monooxygenase [Streptomyces]MBP2362218.1 FMN-dependent oxidoreductase (nitrilotriacetate monooxygenase family) [Streptomyces clavifer]MDX2747423.1 NtaA/DmoA family FMN-dependent monooxygenase [Streptomyces sp. NRRL_B-2557]MDX3063711.1 NtaA/DmoA family FMN-dependent monooxygenase [Streptomyces sp. ND04-05B]WRY81288.1 NtaA/DmoA family FMN-dependent monooxygenase [Streptomyces clavifer]GHB07491.1 nitrilotriacetate monooxygenase component A [Streptom